MSPEIQGMFEKCANDVRISLEQWFEHRMSNNENLRRQHQWRIFSSVLNLRADLEDKWSVISYNTALRKWEKEKEKVDDNFIRATSKWENDCRTAKAQHEKKLKDHEKSLREIADYPAKLEAAEQAHKTKEEGRKKAHAQKIEEHEIAIADWQKPKKERGPKPRSPGKQGTQIHGATEAEGSQSSRQVSESKETCEAGLSGKAEAEAQDLAQVAGQST